MQSILHHFRPKLAITALRKRMMSRNPKVLYLCLELLEVAANACELNFQTQIAGKDFMTVLNALVSREIDKTVLIISMLSNHSRFSTN